MRHVILVHGDCDGIIAGALYVKHFLRDRYPIRYSTWIHTALEGF